MNALRAALGDDPATVLCSDAFDDPAVVAAAAHVHRHAFSDPATLRALLHAHRTARRIVVATRNADALRSLCDEHAAVLIPLP